MYHSVGLEEITHYDLIFIRSNFLEEFDVEHGLITENIESHLYFEATIVPYTIYIFSTKAILQDKNVLIRLTHYLTKQSHIIGKIFPKIDSHF